MLVFPELGQWRNRRGGGWGPGREGRVPPETSDREISADLPGKKRQGKRGKGVKIEKKKKEIIVKGEVKIENGRWKSYKMRRGQKLFTPGKNQENKFAP